MPPKGKPRNKFTDSTGSKRQFISLTELRDNSLSVIPADAVEGYEERIHLGIQWTLIELAARHHREMCRREDIPQVFFHKALRKRLNCTMLKGFFHNNTGLSFEEQYDFNVPITIWDIQKFGSEEQQFLFNCCNSITDDLFTILKKVAPSRSVKVLEDELKTVKLLRVFDTKMTNLDSTLLEFRQVKFLNLCGNYIKEVDTSYLPLGLEALELQTNAISNVDGFIKSLPVRLAYLGLSRNLLENDGIISLRQAPHNISVIDLSDNDIMNLSVVLRSVKQLPLAAFSLAGNPCAMCIRYAQEVMLTLPNLKYLDGHELNRASMEPIDVLAASATELLYTYFTFNVIRIMAVPVPPKSGPKEISTFHVEVELPLLDSVRRNFLMFGENEDLSVLLPLPEEEEATLKSKTSVPSASAALMSKSNVGNLGEEQEPEFNIYDYLAPVNLRKVRHYTIYESNKNSRWENIMYFQEPTVKIMCPDLRAVRDTFRSKITLRLVYSVVHPPAHQPPKAKHSNTQKKTLQVSDPNLPVGEYRVTLATITCDLRRVDWAYPTQQFSWDATMETGEAEFQEENALSCVQYTAQPAKVPKVKDNISRDFMARKSVVKEIPENLTIQVSFGIGS